MNRRQHRRDSKRRLLKQARALYHESCQLQRQQWDAELVPLDEPYQRGWVRYFKWSEEATRRRDFKTMEGVLEVLQNRQWSRHPDFRGARWKNRPRQGGWAPRLSLHPKQLLKACRDPKWLRYFSINGYQPLCGPKHLRVLIASGWNGRLRFQLPQLLEPQLEPYYVTHIKLRDPAIDARIAEIDAWIDQHGGWNFIRRAIGWRSWGSWSERDKMLRKAATKEVQEELERRGYVRAFRFFGAMKGGAMAAGISLDASLVPHGLHRGHCLS